MMTQDDDISSSFQWRNGSDSHPKVKASEFIKLPVEITTARKVSLVHLIVN